jgi:hypothetical protein
MIIEDCPNRIWQKGCKIGKDPGMPEGSWGSYLPGDEPHFECSISGDYCYPGDPVKVKDCDMFENIKLFICQSKINGDCDTDEPCEGILYSKEINHAYCLDCEDFFEARQEHTVVIIGFENNTLKSLVDTITDNKLKIEIERVLLLTS